MATYLYKCPDCGAEEEVIHGMMAHPIIVCDSCLTHKERVLSAKYTGMTRKTGDNKLSDWEETKFRG